MNRRIAALVAPILMIAASVSHASTSVESSFTFGNTWGLKGQYELDLRDSDVVLNEKKLSEEDARRAAGLVAAALSATGGEGKLDCHSGTFKHLVRRGDTVVVERGCVEEHRFGELYRAYSRIGKSASLNGR